MDIRNWYLARLNQAPYELVNRANGQFVCRVTESFSDPYYLGWFEGEDGLTAGFDVHRALPYNGQPHLVIVGDHQVKRATLQSPWITTSQQDYTGGCPMFPLTLTEGEAGEIASSGRWTWTQFSDAGVITATGQGSWAYTSRYEFGFGRFHWEEIETEDHDNNGQVVPYHRIHSYDATGWLGFIDRLTGSMAVRKEIGV